MKRLSWVCCLVVLGHVGVASAQSGWSLDSRPLPQGAPTLIMADVEPAPAPEPVPSAPFQEQASPPITMEAPDQCPTCGQTWPEASCGPATGCATCARRNKDRRSPLLAWLCFVPAKSANKRCCDKPPACCTPPLYTFFSCCLDGQCGSCDAGCCGTYFHPILNPGQVWGSVDYLFWWIQDAPLPIPLVTTGNANNPLAGVLDQPDTRVLFGGEDLDYGTFTGLRATFGGWLDIEQTHGLEASGFLLERRAVIFSASSDDAGSPPLTFPFFDSSIGLPNGVFVASPIVQPFAGSVGVTSQVRFWGAELNRVVAGRRDSDFRIEWLAGFRMLSLDEGIQINDRAQDLTQDVLNILDESFDTRNRFYGGQVGGRIAWDGGMFFYQVQGQLAMGGTYQSVNVAGTITQSGADAFAPGVNQGGVYAQPTNIGQRHTTVFTVVPAFQLRAGMNLCRSLKAWVGYDFIFWSSVARPGDQIDPVINPTQSPIFGDGNLIGQQLPQRRFDQSGFYTQGISLTLEYRY